MKLTTILTSAALGLVATAADAQDFSGDWSGQATIYGWLPSITGAQERRDGSPLVDLGNADVLDALQGAFFAAAEARKGDLGFMVDLAYAGLGKDGSARGTILPGRTPASAAIETKILMTTGAVSYRFYNENQSWIDAYGGLRYYDVSADFKLKIPTLGFNQSRSADASWVDGIIGVRGHVPLSDRFAMTGLADVGGFGIGDSSNMSWQVLATLDYAFTPNVIGRIGYRYLSIDKSSSDLSMDMDLYGPMVGISWAF